GLSKNYPRVRALDNLTLDIPGGAVGLLGPNGAGKSTLIKILLGFTPPGDGSVRVLGLDPARRPLEIRQQVGYMPEVESHIPTISAVDYVYLAARLTGLPHTDAMQRTHRVLNYVGLHDERYRKIGTYSTGMKQKVKFAQAIVHHPKLLLLDEPTTGLDPRAREEMLLLIRDIAHGKGIDVVLSTHILHDVEVVCDHVVIMHRGALIASDPLSTMTSSVESAYDVRIKGDRDAFLAALRTEGLEGIAAAEEADAVRIVHRDGTGPILRAAVSSGVQIRRLSRPQTTLEDRFSKLLGA
ncbi:MAG TPA: ABC transporter ATP-binding protein, partial [Planctomycetota bacterium]|nr:ABC transporter ATP-binding protein [Planctomycetota bacterium]